MAVRGRRPSWGAVVLVALALLPWSWYLVRDIDARLDVVSFVWPLLGAGAVAFFALLALLLWRRRLLLVAVSWALATVAVVVGPWRPLDTGTPTDALRIAAVNIFGDHTYAPGVAEEVAAQHPDLVVVSEVTDDAMAVFDDTYEDVAWPANTNGTSGDVAVFTDLPMQAGPLPSSLRSQRGLRAEIDGPAGAFVLYALHLQKPSPEPNSTPEVGFRSHRQIIDDLVDAMEDEELPVVVAGDLNLGDRTSGYRALTDVLDDGLRSGWVGPTSLKRSTRVLLARIDHVFVPEDWCSADGRTFTMRGSDHRGVVTTIGPCKG